jgi:hypothetical protein
MALVASTFIDVQSFVRTLTFDKERDDPVSCSRRFRSAASIISHDREERLFIPQISLF